LFAHQAMGEEHLPPQALTVTSPLAQTNRLLNQTFSAEEINTISVFEKASRSVVYITNTAIHRDIRSLNTFDVSQGSGSGFVWDHHGHIVTNYHVIQGADAIEVVLEDQSVYQAAIIGLDPDHDLAVLKIQGAADKLTPLEIGDSQYLR